MKTTIDIPDAELREAMRITGAKTKREAVLAAIIELNRRHRAKSVVARFGKLDGFLTQEDLRRMREEP
jgi:Arc/MetJ family transcription regulator